MFAIVKTGGKQYRVTEGDVVKVEKLDGEVGKNISIDEVLMVGDDKGVKTGEPLVEGASVTFEVLEQKKDKKIVIFKKKRRQNYRRKRGHRQEITVLRVKSIAATAGKKAPAKKAAPAKEAPAKEATAKKAPAKKAPAKKAAAKTEKKATA
ncbi:MAG: 50S ribosomal protein L21 [Kordiimonadales bacterium]|nr:MAG: 50S ribosomal protein L21 [Kordiimonadales bacterium]